MYKAEFLKTLPLETRSIHCVGIGGIGVSAIAGLLLEGGFSISGSDIAINENCSELQKRGAVIAPAGHRVENLPDNDCCAVISTAAANMSNPEISAMLKRGAMFWSRGEFLGELCRCYQRPVMVAGSHGKSSTTAMLGWIIKTLSVDAGLLLGAKYQDASGNYAVGNGDILLAEADESDGTHALLSGELALITNIDGDHAWNAEQKLRQEKEFIRFAKSFRHAICIDSAKCRELFAGLPHCRILPEEHLEKLAATTPEWMLGYERSNAALALAGAEYLQIDPAKAAEALKSYPGIKRRQNEVLASGNIKVVEDYAHHPTEVAASLDVLRLRYPEYALTVIFQPHRSKRLQHYFNEFVEIFKNPQINVVVLPVFSAWESVEIDAPDHNTLAAAVNAAGGNAVSAESDFSILAEELGALHQKSAPQLIALIGAGDIENLTAHLKAILVEH
ncbi:MAG: hypothetical protein J6S19_04695 [Lentisphaeria bacterium]|nr:hypothetical protein [Lentisphaeria bacterium]